MEVAVRVVETRGGDVLQPDGASIHADASCTEDAEPQHSIQEGQGAHDPVLDGASARDACHESADDRAQAIGALAVFPSLLSQCRVGKGCEVAIAMKWFKW